MLRVDWLNGLPATRESTPPKQSIWPDPSQTVGHRSRLRHRRRQGERIKRALSQSPSATVIPNLLHEMQQALGVRLNSHSLENPGYRLVWRVSFDYLTPWAYHYFVVRRLFAGRKLAPDHIHYLGPDWEAPNALLGHTEEQLAHLASQEEVNIHSAAGVQVVRVGEAGWVEQLQTALREAYRHPLRQGPAGHQAHGSMPPRQRVKAH